MITISILGALIFFGLGIYFWSKEKVKVTEIVTKVEDTAAKVEETATKVEKDIGV